MAARHLVITVHGIRTFGEWQERLEVLTAESTAEKIQFTKIDYGYFSVIAFFLPFVRWVATRRIKQLLLEAIQAGDWQRIDIVAHSFGTHLVSWSLKSLCGTHRGQLRIHTLILAGSVLRAWFRWQPLVDGERNCVNRVVNECGTRDSILILSQLGILFTGMAGRIGFRGRIGQQLRNRYFEIGHSGYFVTAGQPNDFMKRWWLPLITRDEPVLPHDERDTGGLSGIQTWLLQLAEPIKASVYVAVIYVAAQYSMGVMTEARHAGLDRIFEMQAGYSRDRRDEQAAINALEAYSFNEAHGLGRRADVEEAIRQAFSARPFRFEISERASVRTGAISNDGNKMLLGFENGQVETWNLGQNGWSSDEVTSLSSPVNSLAFAGDSLGFVVGRRDGSVQYFEDPASNQQPGDIRKCPGEVLAVSATDKGSVIAAGTENGELCLWNSAERPERRVFQYQDSVRAVTISRDGKQLVVAEGNRLYLRSISNIETEPFTAITGIPERERITTLAFNEDASILAVASYQAHGQIGEIEELGWSFIRLWRTDRPDKPIYSLPRVQTMVLSLAVGQDFRLAAAGTDGAIRIWEPRQLDKLDKPVVLKTFSGPALFAGFGGDPDRLLTIGVGKPAVIAWDYAAAVAYPRSFHGSRRPALSLGFCKKDYTELAVGYQMEGGAYFFDLERPDASAHRLPALDGEVVALSCAADKPERMVTGRGVFLGDGNGKLRLWDLNDLDSQEVLGEHLGSVMDVTIQANGRIVASAGEDDGLVKVLDTETNESLEMNAHDLGGAPLAVDITDSGGRTLLAVGTENGVVAVYQISMNQLEIWRLYQFHVTGGVEVLDVAFSAGNHRLAAAYADGIVREWELSAEVKRAEHELDDIRVTDSSRMPMRVAYSPDGMTLAAGDTEGFVYLWQTEAFHEKASLLQDGPRRTIYSLVFDQRGETLAAGFADGVVKQWVTLPRLLEQGCRVLGMTPSSRARLAELESKTPCID